MQMPPGITYDTSLLADAVWLHYEWKKVLGETQTLRAGRSNAEPKIFAPP